MAQLVKHRTLTQVMISPFMNSSPKSGSMLTAQSLEPPSDSVSPSLSLPQLCSLFVSLSQRQINVKKKKKEKKRKGKKRKENHAEVKKGAVVAGLGGHGRWWNVEHRPSQWETVPTWGGDGRARKDRSWQRGTEMLMCRGGYQRTWWHARSEASSSVHSS